MAEWLRRQTWNLVGFARVGSNPAADVFMFFVLLIIWRQKTKQNKNKITFFHPVRDSNPQPPD